VLLQHDRLLDRHIGVDTLQRDVKLPPVAKIEHVRHRLTDPERHVADQDIPCPRSLFYVRMTDPLQNAKAVLIRELVQVIVAERDGIQDGGRQRVQRVTGRNRDPAPHPSPRDLEDVRPLPEGPLGDGQVVPPLGEVGLERGLQHAKAHFLPGFKRQDTAKVAKGLGPEQGQQRVTQRRAVDPFDAPAFSRLGRAVPDRYQAEQFQQAQVVPARCEAQRGLDLLVPGDRHSFVRDAEKEPLPLHEHVGNTSPETSRFADDLGEPPQQPGLEQRAVPFGGVQALPRPVDRLVDGEQRLPGRPLDAGQPRSPHQQVQPVDVGVRLLQGLFQAQLEGARQPGVDLGQRPPGQLMHARDRELLLPDERQQRVEIVENGAGAALVDDRVPQQPFVLR